jgi:hypothetical protein
MFYETQNIDQILRFGDVIDGFIYSIPNYSVLDRPQNPQFQIEITKSQHFVVITPCCNIEDGVISITPLKQISLKSIFENPYLREDLCRINRLSAPEKSLPPDKWVELGQEKQLKRIEIGPVYVLSNHFIYEPNDYFPEYDLRLKGGEVIKLRYYYIDFKDVFKIKDKKVVREATIPKLLQLSKNTRSELRTKIATFFGKPPEEDLI